MTGHEQSKLRRQAYLDTVEHMGNLAQDAGSHPPADATPALMQARDEQLPTARAREITAQAVAVATLRSLPIFADTPEQALQALARVSMLRPVDRNCEVVRAGERSDFVYLVVSGRLNVSVSDEEGREAIVCVLGRGELFGEMSVLDERACSATVKAAIPSVMVVIAKAEFTRCLQANFDVAHYVMRTLSERLRVANRRIESLALLDVSGRVARVLLEMAEPVSGKQVVTRKMSRQDIAKMVGASRERVSRVVKDLELRGLIEEIDGRIILRGIDGGCASNPPS